MILIFFFRNRGGVAMAKLPGKVALITGAARGQGRSHAVRLAEDGADIVAVDIVAQIPTACYPPATPADLRLTAKLAEGEGARVLTAEADVRDQAALDDVVARTLATFGRIDIVVANAGTFSHAPAWELSDDQWQNVVDVNLTGVWRTVKACVPSMIARRRGGAVVLTSSVTGLHGYANIASYAAAKHGVNGLMRTLANELGPHNIRVNSVCPGLINTDMMMNDETYAMFRPDVANPTLEDAREVFRTKQLLPMDWLEPRDVSNAIAFLVSEEARAITGVALPVDGGQLTRS
jgi:SDR family mycofactocin-dependent oxidoreductase